MALAGHGSDLKTKSGLTDAVDQARRVQECGRRIGWLLDVERDLYDEGLPGMLLAVDGDQRVVGANRVARTSLLLDDRGLQAGISLWTIFERDVAIFRRKDRTDIATRLMIAGSNDSSAALVTPPDQTLTAWQNATNVAFHTRAWM
jgi:transcriptional regulator of acetoin/glycerol metabolism